ncbi:MAG: hypothetical protein JWM39_380 [Parcubacteria group bacterium]|nr:hypothetical protein [Parcubacteria group bacterium]
MNNPEQISPYLVASALFRSTEYLAHLALIADSYLRKGYISKEIAAEPSDEYDTERAAYCLLYTRTEPKTIAGTFRLIVGTHGLPLLSAFPRLAIEGISKRLCESTRVVSAARSLSRGSDPARQVLSEAVIQSVAYASAKGMIGLVSLGSPRIFERINETFFGTQHALAAPYLYHGGIVVPSIIWIDEFESQLAKHAEHMYSRYSTAKTEWAIK